MPERTPHEKETLIFATPEQANTWQEQVRQEVAAQPQNVRRDKEIISEAVQTELATYGEAVPSISHPWEHTPAEHEEAQALVDEAFASDLGVALRQAKKSSHYPRNLDLLHDLLTNEMYEHVKEANLNRQSWGLWVTEVAIIILLAALAVLLLLLTAH